MSEARTPQRPGFRGRIVRAVDHKPGLRSIFISTEKGVMPAFPPGMFISITIPLGDEVRSRPYTIASTFEKGEPFELLFNLVEDGRGSRWLFERKVGDAIDFTGPYGSFILDRELTGEAVFLAEGTAIAPIRPMLRRLLPHASPVHLLYGAAAGQHLVYLDEFEKLRAQYPEFAFEAITENNKATLYQRLLDVIGQRWIRVDQNRARHFFICGIGPEVVRLRDSLRSAGYERRSVRYEKW